MATVREIAKKASVSPSTVSLVLNDRGRVSGDTRRRVLAVADQLDYSLAPAGRPTRQNPRRRGGLGVLYPPRVISKGHFYPTAKRWIDGVNDTLREHGYGISLMAGTGHVEHDPAFRDAIESRVVDGLIVIGVTPEDGYLDWLLEKKVPVVVMNRRPTREEFSYVAIDNQGGGRLAAERLAAYGHKRMAFVGLPGELDLSISHRNGFREGASACGVDIVSEVAVADPQDPDVRSICERLLTDRVTGVFCEGDHIAAACCDCFEAIGVNVPEHISVIGFDNLGIRTASGLAVGSIGYDAHRMGREAAGMLVKLTDDRNFRSHVSLVVSTFFQEGQTLGMCPAGSSQSV